MIRALTDWDRSPLPRLFRWAREVCGVRPDMSAQEAHRRMSYWLRKEAERKGEHERD